MTIELRTMTEAVDLIRQTLDEKGNIYGPTYRQVGLALGVPSQYSIMVRMMEKLLRINNQLRFGRSQKSAEEFLDLACYAVLGLMESAPVNNEEWLYPAPGGG